MKSFGFFCLFGWLMLASVLPACTSQKVSSNGNNWKLVWGSGGGVTGKVTEYVLLPSGQLFKRDAFSQEMKELKRIPQAEAQKLFTQAENAPFSFKHPGNLYHFIRLEADTAQQPSAEAVWGDSQFMPPATVQELYRQLQAFIQ